MISADFSDFGKVPSAIQMLKILDIMGEIILELILRNFIGGQSDLVDLLLFNNLMKTSMSLLEIG